MSLETHITQAQVDEIVGWIVSGLRGGKDHLLVSVRSRANGKEMTIRFDDIAGFVCGELVGKPVVSAYVLSGGSFALDLSLRLGNRDVASYAEIEIHTSEESGLKVVAGTSTLRIGGLGNDV